MDEAKAQQLAAYIEGRFGSLVRDRRISPVACLGPGRRSDANGDPERGPGRGWLLRRIELLRTLHGLDFILDRFATQDGGVRALPLPTLVALREEMERARDLAVDGVSFEDAGLFDRVD